MKLQGSQSKATQIVALAKRLSMYVMVAVPSASFSQASIVTEDNGPRIEIAFPRVWADINVKLTASASTERRMIEDTTATSRRAFTDSLSTSSKSEQVRIAATSAQRSFDSASGENGLKLAASTSTTQTDVNTSEIKWVDESFFQNESKKTDVLTGISESRLSIDDSSGYIEVHLELTNPTVSTIYASVRLGIYAIDPQGEIIPLVAAHISEAGRILPDGNSIDTDKWIAVPPGKLPLPVRYNVPAGVVREWLNAKYSFQARATNIILRKAGDKEEIRVLDLKAERTLQGFGFLKVSEPDSLGKSYMFDAGRRARSTVEGVLKAIEPSMETAVGPSNEVYIARFMGRETTLKPGTSLMDLKSADTNAGSWFVLTQGSKEASSLTAAVKPGDEISVVYLRKADLLSNFRIQQQNPTKSYETGCRAKVSAHRLAKFEVAKGSRMLLRISAKRYPAKGERFVLKEGYQTSLPPRQGASTHRSVPIRILEELDDTAFRNEVTFLLDIDGTDTRDFNEFEALRSITRFTNVRREHIIELKLPDEFFAGGRSTRTVSVVAVPKSGAVTSGRFNAWQDPGGRRLAFYEENKRLIAEWNAWAAEFPEKSFPSMQREHFFRIETAMDTPAIELAGEVLSQVKAIGFDSGTAAYCPRGRLQSAYSGFCAVDSSKADIEADKYCTYDGR